MRTYGVQVYNSANYEVFYKNQKVCRGLDLPVVVKPINQGSSLGVTIVREEKDWESALKTAFAYSNEIIVETVFPDTETSIGPLRLK